MDNAIPPAEKEGCYTIFDSGKALSFLNDKFENITRGRNNRIFDTEDYIERDNEFTGLYIPACSVEGFSSSTSETKNERKNVCSKEKTLKRKKKSGDLKKKKNRISEEEFNSLIQEEKEKNRIQLNRIMRSMEKQYHGNTVSKFTEFVTGERSRQIFLNKRLHTEEDELFSQCLSRVISIHSFIFQMEFTKVEHPFFNVDIDNVRDGIQTMKNLIAKPTLHLNDILSIFVPAAIPQQMVACNLLKDKKKKIAVSVNDFSLKESTVFLFRLA